MKFFDRFKKKKPVVSSKPASGFFNPEGLPFMNEYTPMMANLSLEDLDSPKNYPAEINFKSEPSHDTHSFESSHDSSSSDSGGR